MDQLYFEIKVRAMDYIRSTEFKSVALDLKLLKMKNENKHI